MFNYHVQASIEDDSDSDDSDDEDYDGYEETSLESYTTPLDEEETCVDEYQVFKEVRLLRLILIQYIFIKVTLLFLTLQYVCFVALGNATTRNFSS